MYKIVNVSEIYGGDVHSPCKVRLMATDFMELWGAIDTRPVISEPEVIVDKYGDIRGGNTKGYERTIGMGKMEISAYEMEK